MFQAENERRPNLNNLYAGALLTFGDPDGILSGLFKPGINVLKMLQKHLTGRGKLNVACCAFQKRNAKFLLQYIYMPAYGTLNSV